MIKALESGHLGARRRTSVTGGQDGCRFTLYLQWSKVCLFVLYSNQFLQVGQLKNNRICKQTQHNTTHKTNITNHEPPPFYPSTASPSPSMIRPSTTNSWLHMGPCKARAIRLALVAAGYFALVTICHYI